MAATASVSITGTVTGLPTGSRVLGPMTIASVSAVGSVTDLILASGVNTITVPTGATAAIIQFAVGSVTTKTLKGIAGDTGIVVAKTGTVVINFDTTALPANFVINSSALDTGLTTEITFV